MRARLALAALLAVTPLAAQVPDRDNNPELGRMAGCALQGKTYTCSRADLQRALALTRTVRIDTAPPNRASLAALTALVHTLGKEIATPDQQAGLLLTLEPTQDLGVNIGPTNAVQLARLRVLIVDHSGGPDKLLWVENYTGDPSRPWPLIARATTDQFHHTATTH